MAVVGELMADRDHVNAARVIARYCLGRFADFLDLGYAANRGCLHMPLPRKPGGHIALTPGQPGIDEDIIPLSSPAVASSRQLKEPACVCVEMMDLWALWSHFQRRMEKRR